MEEMKDFPLFDYDVNWTYIAFSRELKQNM